MDSKSGDVFWEEWGAGAQRTVPSDADAVAAVSIYGRQRSGLWTSGNDSCDRTRHTVQTRIRIRSKQQYWHTIHVGLNATRLQWYDALRIEWTAMQQAYRQWSMADGNEATLLEVDVLTKGKGKEKGKEKAKRRAKRKAKSKDKPKEGTSDKSSMKCFFCKKKRPCPKGLLQVLGLAR